MSKWAMMFVTAVAVAASACGSGSAGPSATSAQEAVCSAGRAYATDVGTDAYSWETSLIAIERSAFDQGDDPVAAAGQRMVDAQRESGVSWTDPFLEFAQECESVGSPLHSDPRGMLCDFQTRRRAQYASFDPDVDYCV